MITIYSIEGTTYQPYEIPTQDIKDGAEGTFAVNLMRWLALEVAGLFISPVQVIVLLSLILYPLSY